MATSVYFNNRESQAEQRLIENLCVEFIRIHGVDVYYMPRKLGAFDAVYQEDSASYYDVASLVDVYVKDAATGFGGRGDFLSGLGAEIRDTLTVVVARKTWKEEVGDYDDQARPNEGDVIYFPFNKKLFKVTFVEHESVFYQVGALQVWELRCELFEYSGEVFSTGIPEVDDLTDRYNINIVDAGILDETGLGSILDELNGLPILPEDYVNEGEDELNVINDILQTESDEILDFTCIDPFVARPGTY